jgi:hypothetical protein
VAGTDRSVTIRKVVVTSLSVHRRDLHEEIGNASIRDRAELRP